MSEHDSLIERLMPCALPCPKCGSTDIHREYRANGSKWDIHIDTGEYCASHKFTAPHNYRAVYATREHIAHQCRTCRYDWPTPPLPKPRRPKDAAASPDTDTALSPKEAQAKCGQT